MFACASFWDSGKSIRVISVIKQVFYIWSRKVMNAFGPVYTVPQMFNEGILVQHFLHFQSNKVFLVCGSLWMRSSKRMNVLCAIVAFLCDGHSGNTNAHSELLRPLTEAVDATVLRTCSCWHFSSRSFIQYCHTLNRLCFSLMLSPITEIRETDDVDTLPRCLTVIISFTADYGRRWGLHLWVSSIKNQETRTTSWRLTEFQSIPEGPSSVKTFRRCFCIVDPHFR